MKVFAVIPLPVIVNNAVSKPLKRLLPLPEVPKLSSVSKSMLAPALYPLTVDSAMDGVAKLPVPPMWAIENGVTVELKFVCEMNSPLDSRLAAMSSWTVFAPHVGLQSVVSLNVNVTHDRALAGRAESDV